MQKDISDMNCDWLASRKSPIWEEPIWPRLHIPTSTMVSVAVEEGTTVGDCHSLSLSVQPEA